MNSKKLLKFYSTWYHPNNAIVHHRGRRRPAGDDCQGPALFGDIPAAKLPAREPVQSEAAHRRGSITKRRIRHLRSSLLGYRIPGYDSPDYAAGQILGDVLSSSRSTFGAMPYTGKALGARVLRPRSIQQAAWASRSAAVPVGTQPETIDQANAGDHRRVREERRPGGSGRSGQAARDFAARVQRQLDRRVGFGVESGGRGARPGIAGLDDRAVSATSASPTSIACCAHISITGASSRPMPCPRTAGVDQLRAAAVAKENNEIPPSSSTSRCRVGAARFSITFAVPPSRRSRRPIRRSPTACA